MSIDSRRLFGLNQGILFSELVRLLLANTHWTREYILVSAWNPGDMQQVEERLTRSAADISSLYGQLYDTRRTTALQELLLAYNQDAIRFIDAMRSGDQQAVNEAHAMWSARAAEIARYMADYNRYLDYQTYLAALSNLIFLTEREAYALFSGNYNESVDIYDEIIPAVVQMAWDISYAIMQLFQG